MPLPFAASIPPVYVPGDRTQTTFSVLQWPPPVVSMSAAGSGLVGVPRQFEPLFVWQGGTSPPSGSPFAFACWVGVGVIFDNVPAETSPTVKRLEPLTIVMLKAEFAAFTEASLLSASGHVESTMIEPSYVTVTPPFTRYEAHPTRVAPRGFDGSSRATE